VTQRLRLQIHSSESGEPEAACYDIAVQLSHGRKRCSFGSPKRSRLSSGDSPPLEPTRGPSPSTPFNRSSMYDGQVILATGTGATTTVYSPWFPRGGDHAVFTLEVVAWHRIPRRHEAEDRGVPQDQGTSSGDGSPVSTPTNESIEINANGGPARSSRGLGFQYLSGPGALQDHVHGERRHPVGDLPDPPAIWYDAAKA